MGTIYTSKLRNSHVNNVYFGYLADARLSEVACWPLVPKFAGSNPAEAVGFGEKILSTLPSEGN